MLGWRGLYSLYTVINILYLGLAEETCDGAAKSPAMLQTHTAREPFSSDAVE